MSHMIKIEETRESGILVYKVQTYLHVIELKRIIEIMS